MRGEERGVVVVPPRLKNWHSRPAGRSAKTAEKCGKIARLRSSQPPRGIDPRPTSRNEREKFFQLASQTDAEHVSIVEPGQKQFLKHHPGKSAVLYSTSERRTSDGQRQGAEERVLER